MKTKDGRFSYEAAGDPASPPLVFLHGIGGAARGWRNQLDFFKGHYHAIAWDMPGYGASSPLPAVSITMLADALRDFLQQVGATKPVLIGHSIGGMIVQQFLVQHPDAARAVVLAQTSAAFGNASGDWQKNFIEARLGPLDRGETMRTLATSLVKGIVGDDPDAAGIDLARDCMGSVPDATYRATMLSMLGFDLRAALKNIAVPTLVLSGSKDKNAPAPTMAKMASVIPSAEYIDIEGAGHLVNLERPKAFNAALEKFLGAHAATQAAA